MEVTCIYWPQDRERMLMKRCVWATMSRTSEPKEPPMPQLIRDLLNARHSPIRVLNFAFLIKDIPSESSYEVEEADAAGFRAAVLEALAGPKPVLGVVRLGFGVWGGAPLGEVWDVTEDNRDSVAARLRRRLESLCPGAFRSLEGT